MSRYQNVTKHVKEILFNNFLGGLAWAVGATVGFSIIIFLLANVFRNLGWVPFIGDFLTDITKHVLNNLQSNPQLVQ